MIVLKWLNDHAEYLIHAPCMRIVQTGYERCAIEYQSHVREHSGNANSALGNNAVDDPVENSKKLCWYFIFLILLLLRYFCQ